MAKANAVKKSVAKTKVNRKPKKAKAVEFVLPANVTRSFTLGLVIETDILAGKESINRQELVDRADVIYAKAHGKSANPTEAKWSSNQGIGAMAGLQLVDMSKTEVYFKSALISLIKARNKK